MTAVVAEAHLKRIARINLHQILTRHELVGERHRAQLKKLFD
jgi:hypothetical protein